jgi:predicted nucleic acid-binding protein
MSTTRIAFADTNWLYATYYDTPDTEHVIEWAGQPSTLVISSAVLAECRCNFWRGGDRLAALESDLRARRITDCGLNFETLSDLSGDAFRRFASRSNVGTLDILHVVAAKRFGCQWFLSFDVESGCRAMAAAAGLKVYPPIAARDRKLLARFR